jgi:glycosyltransferase involved in cell wall biosynthesis
MMKRYPLTAVVLTFNEEARVGRCIRSLAQLERVVVLDSFSQDETRAQVLAAWKDLGRESSELCFVERAWQGFTEARSFSQSLVTSDWVLWIDADEWLEADLQQSLTNFDFSRQDCDVFKMARQSYFLGSKIRYGGWYPDRKARLARRDFCEWRKGPRGADVHEDLYSTRDAALRQEIAGHLGHEPFLSRAEQQATNDRYSSLLAQGLAQDYREGRKRPLGPLMVALKVVIKFLENYIFKLGILDGRAGLIIALGSAQSLCWRLQKARALHLDSSR